MRHVEKLMPWDVPGACMFYPQRRQDPNGFVVGAEIDASAHAGVITQAASIEGIRQVAAKYAGMVDAEELRGAEAEIAALKAEIVDLELEIDNLNGRIDAI